MNSFVLCYTTELCMERGKNNLNKIPSMAGYIHSELLDTFPGRISKACLFLSQLSLRSFLYTVTLLSWWNCIRDDKLG